jgi:ribonuclease HI
MGYGAVVRDDLGLVVAAQAVTLLGSLDPCLAEAGAILKAIQLCVSLGLQRVIFEGDSKGVVDGIHSTAENWSHKGMMLDDIRIQLQHVSHWRVEFVRREGNQAAHTSAKMASKDCVNQQWVFVTPYCIVDIARMERIALSVCE